MLAACGTAFMHVMCMAILTWFYQNTEQRFSFMVVSGTGIPAADTRRHQPPEPNSG